MNKIKDIIIEFNKNLEKHLETQQFKELKNDFFNKMTGLNIEKLKQFLNLAKNLDYKDYTGCYLISDRSKINDNAFSKVLELHKNKNKILEMVNNYGFYKNYIGQAKKILKRLKEHLDNRHDFDWQQTYFYGFKQDQEHDMTTQENHLINKYNAYKDDGGFNKIHAKQYKKNNKHKKIINSTTATKTSNLAKLTKFLNNLGFQDKINGRTTDYYKNDERVFIVDARTSTMTINSEFTFNFTNNEKIIFDFVLNTAKKREGTPLGNGRMKINNKDIFNEKMEKLKQCIEFFNYN